MPDPKTWLITGVSGGLGRSLAHAALARGDTVIGTLRQTAALAEFEALAPGRAFAVQVDVTDRDAIRARIPQAIEARGRLDVLVNNAGYALTGALEEVSDDEITHQIETNFLGAARIIVAALPTMRAQGSGRIFNISSQGGIIGYPGLSIYSASKFALEGLSESLRRELAPFGIHVTIVEPGGFRTDWAGRSMVYASCSLPAYAALTEQAKAANTGMDGQQPGDPDKAARALLALADVDVPPLRVVLGSDALAGITKKLSRTLAEIEASAELARSTDVAASPGS